MFLKTVKDPMFWKRVQTDSAYAQIIDQINQYYSASHWDEIPCLKYKPRMRFYSDGDRHAFEKPYFRRRRYLASAALLALIYPEKKQYLIDVQECLWAICDEYSWCLPAHCDGTLEDDLHRIDLFAAETGFMLTEISVILEENLDKLVLDRVRSVVRSRIINSYLDGIFFWESCKTNWAAVCAGNVGGTLMYLDPPEFERQLPRLLDTMHSFLEGFAADGTCMEGFSYWHYGFGNFVWFADLLYQYSDGKVDLFEWEKVEAISGYCQRSFLIGGITISNSDGTATGKADRGINNFLHHRFPKSVQRLPNSYTHYSPSNTTWMYMLRNLVYAEHQAKHINYEPKDVFLPEAGQAVLHRRGYSFYMKGGNNREPHNHNDVGSFILATERGQIFCDLGAGLYTRQYFNRETRCTIFCISSLSHNVPIVNGQPQLYGDAYRGTICCANDTVTVNFAESYGQKAFSKLTRTAICEDGKVTLKDVFSENYESLCERFVTKFEPEIYDDRIFVNGVCLRFDPHCSKAAVSTELFYPHDAAQPPETVYCIDFNLAPGLSEATFIFEVSE